MVLVFCERELLQTHPWILVDEKNKHNNIFISYSHEWTNQHSLFQIKRIKMKESYYEIYAQRNNSIFKIIRNKKYIITDYAKIKV